MKSDTRILRPLAKNIKHLRKQRGYSQEELAKQLDISRSNVAAYESKGVEPRLRIILAMAQLFDVDIRTFIADDLAESEGEVAPFHAGGNSQSQATSIDIADNDALAQLSDKTIQMRKVVDGFKAYQEMDNLQLPRDIGPYSSSSFLDLLDQLIAHNETLISTIKSTHPS